MATSRLGPDDLGDWIGRDASSFHRDIEIGLFQPP
jgi:hypothetical protein